MDQFLYGLLAGIAVGMWLAILIYSAIRSRWTGRLQRFVPLPFLRTAGQQVEHEKLVRSSDHDDSINNVGGSRSSRHAELPIPDDVLLAAPVALKSDSPIRISHQRVNPVIEETQVTILYAVEEDDAAWDAEPPAQDDDESTQS